MRNNEDNDMELTHGYHADDKGILLPRGSVQQVGKYLVKHFHLSVWKDW